MSRCSSSSSSSSFCGICKRPFARPEDVHETTIYKETYRLCEWDALKIRDLIEGWKSDHMENIFWGAGHISWTCWETIRGIIRRHGLTEILEFGIGLSSELFVNEGLKVVGFDACQPHVEKYQKLLPLKNGAVFHHYNDKGNGPPVEAIYPGRTWDFVFVDGPQERSMEVHVAMRVSRRFIYLHDPNMGEETFFPNHEWEGIGTEPRLFIRKETAK